MPHSQAVGGTGLEERLSELLEAELLSLGSSWQPGRLYTWRISVSSYPYLPAVSAPAVHARQGLSQML